MSKPSDYVTEMFHKLREDISEIKHRLFTDKPRSESITVHPHYTIDAIHKDRESQEENENSIRATLNLPPTIRIDAKTEEGQKPWKKDRSAWLQIFTISVAVVVAIIYWSQLQAMLASNRESTKNFRIDQRPMIQIRPDLKGIKPVINQPVEVPVEIVNIGKTVARDVHGFIDLTTTTVGDESEKAKNPAGEISVGTIFPQEIKPRPVRMVEVDPVPGNPLRRSLYSDQLLKGLGGGKVVLELFGEIYYSDTFGTDHWLKFCFLGLSGDTEIGITRSPTRLEKACISGNEVDSN